MDVVGSHRFQFSTGVRCHGYVRPVIWFLLNFLITIGLGDFSFLAIILVLSMLMVNMSAAIFKSIAPASNTSLSLEICDFTDLMCFLMLIPLRDFGKSLVGRGGAFLFAWTSKRWDRTLLMFSSTGICPIVSVLETTGRAALCRMFTVQNSLGLYTR